MTDIDFDKLMAEIEAESLSLDDEIAGAPKPTGKGYDKKAFALEVYRYWESLGYDFAEDIPKKWQRAFTAGSNLIHAEQLKDAREAKARYAALGEDPSEDD